MVTAFLGLSFSTGGLVLKFDKADNRRGGSIGAESRKFLSDGVYKVVCYVSSIFSASSKGSINSFLYGNRCGVLTHFVIFYALRSTDRLCGNIFLILENRDVGVVFLLFFI